MPKKTINTAYKKPDEGIIIVFLLLLLVSVFCKNTLLAIGAGLLFPLFVPLLWRNAEPPILWYGGVMLWLNAALQIYYFNFSRGMSLEELSGSPGLTMAASLTLIGSLVVSVGIKAGVGQMPPVDKGCLSKHVSAYSIPKVFILYLVTFVTVFSVNAGAIHSLGGLASFTFALRDLKWVFLYLLLFLVFFQNKGYLYLILAAFIEVFTGFLGYFAGFRGFFLILPLAYLTVYSVVSLKKIFTMLCFTVFVLIFVFTWQIIKHEYRNFLNQGTKTQSVQVSIEERIDKLFTLINQVDQNDYAEISEVLVNRIAYIEYFGHVVDYIPDQRPYDGGQGWLEAFEHIIKPRIFFPDKPPVHDSFIARKYTGQYVAGPELGASINIGYFGETYADFGPVFMFIPIFFVGFFFGRVYRFFIKKCHDNLPMGYAFNVGILIFAVGSLPSVPKLLGLNIVNFVIFYLVLRFLIPTISSWLLKENPHASPEIRQRPLPQTL